MMVVVNSTICFLDILCSVVIIIRWRTLSKKSSMSMRRSEKSLLFLACSICFSLSLSCVLQQVAGFCMLYA
ncbi:hypothetical protein RB195_013981 [Necator americanus]